ncbi:cilia- and flagella-associated protein 299 [Drosophila eugracilis]|uniref:cilia- and flagella-associated protein 299 n=1 Tax=Drosophila eugracilis TaxID=29029 RepID=UPI0007E5F2B3|nr:cilia- and flagella-associated protein 299 [Drosophila eugracilis]
MSLINFNQYQDYVDSFITNEDIRYLGHKDVQRKLIQDACGRNCLGNLLTPEQFLRRKANELILTKPRGICGYQLFGDYLNSKDEVLQQFASREQKLIQKQLSTVVYLVMRSKKGLEISSFLDLEQSFREARCQSSMDYVDWRGIFEGRVKLMPSKRHLSYFDWHRNQVSFTNSDNFRVDNKRAHSLLVIHVGDHKMFCVNATCDCEFSKNASRETYFSPIYGYVIFFDHIIRRIN